MKIIFRELTKKPLEWILTEDSTKAYIFTDSMSEKERGDLIISIKDALSKASQSLQWMTQTNITNRPCILLSEIEQLKKVYKFDVIPDPVVNMEQSAPQADQKIEFAANIFKLEGTKYILDANLDSHQDIKPQIIAVISVLKKIDIFLEKSTEFLDSLEKEINESAIISIPVVTMRKIQSFMNEVSVTAKEKKAGVSLQNGDDLPLDEWRRNAINLTQNMILKNIPLSRLNVESGISVKCQGNDIVGYYPKIIRLGHVDFYYGPNEKYVLDEDFTFARLDHIGELRAKMTALLKEFGTTPEFTNSGCIIAFSFFEKINTFLKANMPKPSETQQNTAKRKRDDSSEGNSQKSQGKNDASASTTPFWAPNQNNSNGPSNGPRP